MKKYTLLFLILAIAGLLTARTGICGSYTRNIYKAANDHAAMLPDTSSLKIGDKVPDLTINNIYNFPTKKAKISDFRGKLLIIDFWATWCSPCVHMIPIMDTLQRKFAGRVQFMPVSYQSEKEVLPFLQRLAKGRASDLPDVFSDTSLSGLFPHTYLPHYVWIDGSGIVKAVTTYEEVNENTINAMLNSHGVTLAVKNDNELIRYDPARPLFFNGNGGDGSTVTYHSLFGGFVKGLASGFQIEKSDTARGITITAKNSTIPGLFQVAYMNVAFFGRNRMIFDTKDTSALFCPFKGAAADDWLSRNHGFCYELQVPATLRNKAFSIMQNDLDMLLSGYHAHVERRMRQCLVLTRTGGPDRLKTSGGETAYHFDGTQCVLQNAPLSILCGELNVIYLHHLPTPVIDETGYTGNVDLEIGANMQNVGEINEALAAYNLKLVPMERQIDVLVISDNQN